MVTVIPGSIQSNRDRAELVALRRLGTVADCAKVVEFLATGLSDYVSDYTIAGRGLVAEGADLRVQVLTLAAGQCVPWHYHSEISDSFVCLEGPMVVETRAPRHIYRLLPGGRCAVPSKTAHYGPCKFLIVQGVGVYDFVPVNG